MIILIDNGHGSNTAGKCSPDKKHREYKWSRDFASRLETALKAKGYNAQRIVTETTDISISTRCRRVNIICREFGVKNVILLSMHNDAMPPNDNKWHTARGFSARVSLNASSNSKKLATCIAKAVESAGITVRKPLKTQYYWPQNLGICRDTNCPAVLCENLFQDNKEDVALLYDEAFLSKLCDAYVEAIENYLK